MSARQHTPGPWFACSGNARQKYNIECKGTHNECWPIATLRGPDREANAHLLAAAPELLEALQMLLKHEGRTVTVYSGIGSSQEPHPDTVAALASARAAIAKAEGRAE